MKAYGSLIALALFASSAAFAATSGQVEKPTSCDRPFEASGCLEKLAAPKDLPPTVKIEEFRAYAQKLALIGDEIADSARVLAQLQRIPLAPTGRVQLEKSLKLTASVQSDIAFAKQQIGSFADLQYYASRASLSAGRIGNALAELRLSVLPGPDAMKTFEFLQEQIASFDELGSALMPDWLN